MQINVFFASNLGNEVVFSLETASDYVKDDKACFYGFKCTVVGYEWAPKPEEVDLFQKFFRMFIMT